MAKILGLDLGTNSIGWALVDHDFENKQGKILGLGSRIIPMSQETLGNFDKGVTESATKARTGFRGVRRLHERYLLRRERLHRALNVLGFLPEHFAKQIDFEKHVGQFLEETEPKLAYKKLENKGKPEFIFKESFKEMLADFAKHQPQLLLNNKGELALVPYDWTIYYLRKKALNYKIEKEELAWLLLNFNQKRGYYQLRGEEDEDATRTAQTRIYFATEKIEEVTNTGQEYKGLKIFKVKLGNGETGKYYNKVEPNWTGQLKNIIATVDLDKDGNDRKEDDGSLKRKFTIATEEDWETKWKLVKIKTEKEIKDSNKTVGAYIYDTLLKNPTQKIKGKLVRTIERKFYEEELRLILDTQKLHHPELQSDNLYTSCVEELYTNNEAHRNSIGKRDFTYLFLNDIIFYQRPLKSKKSLISDCRYESRTYKGKDGLKITEPIKCIPKSHPLFQEFRLWQWIKNLAIYQREKEVDGKIQIDVNVTNEFLKNENDYVKLFEWLNDRKEITQEALLKYAPFGIKKNTAKYRWNYVEDNDKKYPCNETRSLILTRLSKVAGVEKSFLTKELEEALWHILYSVEDKLEIKKALKSFAAKHNLGEDFVEEFRKLPPFPNDYGSYSAKAIKKLLPLMRMGSYWSYENIEAKTQERIDKLLTAEYDEKILERVREKAIHLSHINNFKGLPLWLACYIVYNVHSEEGDIKHWKTPKDIEDYLRFTFKQHSLRNPIVEQVITETLRVVTDIWKQYGNGAVNFFSEIHVELGREMKNPADKRKAMTAKVASNENTNLRIKALLIELLNDEKIENVRPYSPSQQEILKIYEDGVLNAAYEVPEEILKISKLGQPSKSELLRYKLWIDQKYRSPYTGEPIPLGKLFTTAYEIEHIIPQSRHYDDSFSNKVICESEVNKDKDHSLGYEYIRNNPEKIVELSYGKKVKLFSVSSYENFVKEHFAGNRGKRDRLLMDEIPSAFIERQMNDTRYITKIVKNLLSNIVREEKNDDGATSKNLIPTNGNITSTLKQDWGLNDIWNELITPRFERMNELTKTTDFGEWTEKEGKKVFQTQMPLSLQKGFSKKRIDHRHHALDALIVACTNRNHINFLNNQSALEKGKNKEQKEKSRHDLKTILCYKKYNANDKQNYKWVFKKPWETLTQEAREELYTTIISFKQNLRVINKTTNHYTRWVKDETGELKKETVKQNKGDTWAIRKPIHKDTIKGSVRLRNIKTVSLSIALKTYEDIVNKSLRAKVKELSKENFDDKKILKYFKERNNLWEQKDVSRVEIFYWELDSKGDNTYVASRVKLNETFNSATIQSITDKGIQKILSNHLEKYNEQKEGKTIEHPELAFSSDGIDGLNANLTLLNAGKPHQPIYKVRTYEPKGNKFSVGVTGNKKGKFVEAAKGTNLFFAIYQDENKKRSYEAIPLNIVIERQKQGLISVPEKNETGHSLFCWLSPNDLVYVPTEAERESPQIVNFEMLSKEQVKRVYKVVSFSGVECYFIQTNIASLIVQYNAKLKFGELGSQNKLQTTLDGCKIADFCWKLEINRVGKIMRVIK